MTPEQQAAYVNAQAALLNCEVARMQAENQYRHQCGLTVSYGECEFMELQWRYEGVLGHNAVLTTFSLQG